MRQWEAYEGGKFISKLVERGIRFLGVEEATEICGKTRHATVMLLNRLEQSGWLVRLNRGRYALTDINQVLADDDGQDLDKLAVGRELAGGEGYYIGYGSALKAHGMATAPGLPDFVTVVLKGEKRLPRRKVLGVEYRFVRDPLGKRKIVNPKAKPAQWMMMEVEVVANERVWVSDPEWTILSGLGRPELCGGIGVITAALDGWRERLELEKLVRYTNYMRNMTAARRLGYLLERLGMHTEWTRLRLSLQVQTSYGRLEPGRAWKGDLERKWRVDVNSNLNHGGAENTEGTEEKP